MSRYLFYISQNYSFAILRPLQKAILNRGDNVAWFVEGNDVNLHYFKQDEIRLKDVKHIIDFNPLAVFVAGNVVPSFIPGLKVGVFHGFNAGKRNSLKGHFKIRGCFDLYCTQGPNTTTLFKKLSQQHQFFNVVETGWPAIDPLFDNLPKEKKQRPTILMCSTFTNSLTCAPHLYKEVKRLSQNKKWQWIIQFHPKMSKEIVEKYKRLSNENLSFIETDNIIPLLQKADVMVCDTSSVLIMFLLLSKPVVSYNNRSPANYLIDINNPNLLESSIETALSRPEKLINNINNFIKEVHPQRDGKSAERILETVDNILENNIICKKNKPKNIIRSFKMRKSLNYWRFW